MTDIGPVMTLAAPNITSANMGAAYSDGEIARLLRHGLKKDGRSVRFMPVKEVNWLPHSDIVAVISYLRTVPPVERSNQGTVIKTLGKILDRQDKFTIDVARRIDHEKGETPPAPAPDGRIRRLRHAARAAGAMESTSAGARFRARRPRDRFRST